jgi:hypothetical protein
VAKMKFYDPEWEEASHKDEKKVYYWVNTGKGIYIKLYKPSIAKLVEKRTGFKFEEVLK